MSEKISLDSSEIKEINIIGSETTLLHKTKNGYSSRATNLLLTLNLILMKKHNTKIPIPN